MTSADPGKDDSRPKGRDRLLTWAAAAACILVMVWMGLGWDLIRAKQSYVGSKTDYYSSLIHGFRSGHLYLDKERYPGWDSPDPAVRAKAPNLLDASYYQGRYYLYFGVTPAALFLLPYSLLTGSDLDSRFIVVLCSAAGFLFSLGVLRMALRDHFSRIGPWFQLAAVVTLAFSSAVPSLLTRAMFYELAIASGYAFTMAGAFWTYRALSGRGAPLQQLALASASFGLAVGCRPDLVLNVPVVAAAALLVAWRARDKVPWPRGILRTGVAAVAPAALIGLLLAVYNFERFGSPLEFGVTYSMNYFMTGDKPLFSLAYLWPNIHWYCLTLPALSPYFPYVFPEGAYFGPPAYRWGEVIHGQFPVYLLGAAVIVAAVLLRKRLNLGRLGPFLGLLAWMFVMALVAICLIGFRGDRYEVDFQPSFVLGILLLSGAVGSHWEAVAGRKYLGAGFVGLAGLAALFNVLGGLQEFETFKNIRSPTYKALTSVGNYPAYWLGKMGLLHWGPVEMQVVFPTNPAAPSVEPLLVAGTPDFTDSLYVIVRPPGNRIEFIGDHAGYGGPRSPSFPINPGQTYTLTVDMGALYPPHTRPFISDYKARQVRQLKTGIHVEMDGKPVLDREMSSFDAPPWALEMGRNHVTMNPYKTEFTGRILSARRLPPPALMERDNNGLWRIHCVFPLGHPNASFPVLSLGVTGTGTLVFVSVLPGNQVRFGVDEWGIGGGLSDPFKEEPGSEHDVEILVGPLAQGAVWPADWNVNPRQLVRLGSSLRVWLDGNLAWSTDLRKPLAAADLILDVGANRQGFSTAEAEYPEVIRSIPYIQRDAREFLERNLQPNP